MIELGQALNLKIGYADGGGANKNRPYLIIKKNENLVYALNVSSIKGKSHKVLYDSNIVINRYNPPFRMKSMVKMDSLYIIPTVEGLENCLFAEGKKLNSYDLDYIIKFFEDYRTDNTIVEKLVSKDELLINNSPKIERTIEDLAKEEVATSESDDK
ncbi:hypothetical protein H8S10_11935 [Clostridium sp. NSJ-49]|uniref:hypothetical protein n=1 Tax=Clostridium TaxID=1485 RepID=UPI00164A92CB|nr:hypothetical protein [Clostridium sp. NSJ-49]MBC5626167.1 hypothetical protein [Clostridium sp. NSJ-49]